MTPEIRARLEAYADFLQDFRYQSPYSGQERLRIADLRTLLASHDARGGPSPLSDFPSNGMNQDLTTPHPPEGEK